MLPLNFNFAQDVIDKLAGENRAGLIFIDSYGHRRDYTFAEVSNQSRRYAAVLRALGIAHGDRVLLCTSNTAKNLFTLLGLARLGAVAVPCAEGWSAEQILAQGRRAAVSAVITNRQRRASTGALARELPDSTKYILIGETCEGWDRLDTLTANASPYSGITTQAMDMAYVFGEDVLDYGALLESRASAQSLLQPGASDRVWVSLPMGTQQWLTFVQAPWWAGAATVVHDAQHDARERLDLLRELDVTILCQTAAEYAAQIALPDVDRFRLPRLRRCVVTEQIDAGVERRWSERFGIAIAAPGTAAPASS